jgi:hypothetical protein
MTQFVGIALLGVYIWGIWRFLSGFDKTNFTSNKVMLALLWPALIFNGSYRRNFTKTLKG